MQWWNNLMDMQRWALSFFFLFAQDSPPASSSVASSSQICPRSLGENTNCAFSKAKKLMWLKISSVRWWAREFGLLRFSKCFIEMEKWGIFAATLFSFVVFRYSVMTPNVFSFLIFFQISHRLSDFDFPLTAHLCLGVWIVANIFNFEFTCWKEEFCLL